jgi:hypothetical protein
MITYFFGIKNSKKDIIKSTALNFDLAEKKAEQWAKIKGIELSNCHFTINWLMTIGKEKYNILTLPKGFRAKNR